MIALLEYDFYEKNFCKSKVNPMRQYRKHTGGKYDAI